LLKDQGGHVFVPAREGKNVVAMGQCAIFGGGIKAYDGSFTGQGAGLQQKKKSRKKTGVYPLRKEKGHVVVAVHWGEGGLADSGKDGVCVLLRRGEKGRQAKTQRRVSVVYEDSKTASAGKKKEQGSVGGGGSVKLYHAADSR